MIMNYSHLWEYDNVTFPPNFVMTYFNQVDKWRLGICWTVMMMMARMRLIMTIMTLIVMRTGRRMIIAMLATNPPLSPSSPCCWKRSLVASFQAVPLRLELRQRYPHVRLCKRQNIYYLWWLCDLFTFNSVHHIGRLHSPSWNIWDVIDTGKRFEEVLQPSSASAEC